VSEGPQDAGRPLAVIFLDGDYGDPAYYRAWIERAGILLAADGGARALLRLGARPDAVVGDFDSLGTEDECRLRDAGVELLRHPVRKDMTDGELAVEEALRRGAGELVLVGATGALDHTLGHVAILRGLAARGVDARLAAPSLSVRVATAPATVTLASGATTRVSVVPLDGAAVVTLTGLDYPLDHEVLPADACLGLGNHIAGGEPAEIAVHEGIVAVLVGSGAETFRGLVDDRVPL
jgi:thiamine pyrophosphokinase